MQEKNASFTSAGRRQIARIVRERSKENKRDVHSFKDKKSQGIATGKRRGRLMNG